MLIGYARVSTNTQDHALQVDALKQAGCEKVFFETASGSRDDRPELAKAIEFARPGDVLVVYALSRLSRSLRHTLEIADDLTKRDINIRSLTEAIDTTTPTGKLWLGFCGIMAQAERDSLVARTRDGLAAARARGRVGGRPRALDERKLTVARALIADGKLAMTEVAREVGVAPSTLYRSFPGGREALGA